jgi:hypothetical protein
VERANAGRIDVERNRIVRLALRRLVHAAHAIGEAPTSQPGRVRAPGHLPA